LPHNHIGRKQGCPNCSKVQIEDFIERANTKHENKYDYSKVILINVSTEVTINCPKHGDFKQAPHPHMRGTGCPSCAGQGQTTEGFIKQARLKHGNKYSYEKLKYIDSYTKVIITCPDHGDFEKNPYAYLNGGGCPNCSGLSPLDNQSFIERGRETHDNKYSYEKTKYINAHTKVIITCPDHGDFEQAPNSHWKGHGCANCAGLAPLDNQSFIERAKKIHGDLYGYDKVNYINTKTKVIITCPDHGDFEQVPETHSSGSGCPLCFGKIQYTNETFIKRAIEVQGNKYNYDRVQYVNSHTKVIIICPEHGDFKQRALSHINSPFAGCPKCYNKAEGRVAIYLNSRLITYREFRIENRFFDFYLPDFNTLIERDGQQHYPKVWLKKNIFEMGKNQSYKSTQKNDKYKRDLAMKNGYKLARIPYWLKDKEVELEIDNILEGQPTYPDLPDPKQEKTKPLPSRKLIN